VNFYEMLQEVRENINEPTEQTNGHWSDAQILRKLKAACKKAQTIITSSPGDTFVTSTTLSPSGGIVTLPEDFGKFVYMEDASTGAPVYFGGQTIRERRIGTPLGATLEVGSAVGVFVGNTIELNAGGYTGGVKLWYQKKVIEPIVGTATTGSGAQTLVLPSTIFPKRQDDYYNGLVLEVFSGTGSGTTCTVTDYVSSTKTLTTDSGTFGTDTVFGSDSQFVQEADTFIVLDATVACLAKPSSSIDSAYFQFYNNERRVAKKDLEEYLSTRVAGSEYIRITEVE
jgi:hypothetical protein